MRKTEHLEQKAIFDWANLMSGKYPELQYMFAVPNANKRSYGAARYMKEEGLRPGVPDIVLPVARGEYNALFVELKIGGNKATRNQKIWLDKLNDNGSLALLVYGADNAIQIINDYLDGDFDDIPLPVEFNIFQNE